MPNPQTKSESYVSIRLNIFYSLLLYNLMLVGIQFKNINPLNLKIQRSSVKEMSLSKLQSWQLLS